MQALTAIDPRGAIWSATKQIARASVKFSATRLSPEYVRHPPGVSRWSRIVRAAPIYHQAELRAADRVPEGGQIMAQVNGINSSQRYEIEAARRSTTQARSKVERAAPERSAPEPKVGENRPDKTGTTGRHVNIRA